MNLQWEVLDIRQLGRRIGESYASISDSRISLSPAACDLIRNIYEMPYVEIRIAKDNSGKTRYIGLEFSFEKKNNSLFVTRRKYKGEPVDGLNINSKSLVQILRGKEKEGETQRYEVTNEGEFFLVIDLEKEL